MKPKLLIIAIIIFLAGSASIVLLKSVVQINDKYGLMLIMLQPVFFSLHVIEEFYFPGGGMKWFSINKPEYHEAFTPDYFFKVNAIPLALSYLVSLGSFTYQGSYSFIGLRAWFAMMIFFSINGIFHLRGTIRTGLYSPGMITGILLYFPLTIYSWLYFLIIGKLDLVSVLICTSVALMIQPVLNKIKRSEIRKIQNNL